MKVIFTHKTPGFACFAFQVGMLRLFACCILCAVFVPRRCMELQQLHWIGGDTERCGFASELKQCQCSAKCQGSSTGFNRIQQDSTGCNRDHSKSYKINRESVGYVLRRRKRWLGDRASHCEAFFQLVLCAVRKGCVS